MRPLLFFLGREEKERVAFATSNLVRERTAKPHGVVYRFTYGTVASHRLYSILHHAGSLIIESTGDTRFISADIIMRAVPFSFPL